MVHFVNKLIQVHHIDNVYFLFMMHNVSYIYYNNADMQILPLPKSCRVLLKYHKRNKKVRTYFSVTLLRTKVVVVVFLPRPMEGIR